MPDPYGSLPRAIPLEGASNLRDLGGWPTADGRHVRLGLLYRAPALVNLTPADQAAIAALGLRIVADLRGVRERDHMPVALPGTHAVSLPIEPSMGAGLRDILRTGEADGAVTEAELFGLLREAYEAYAVHSAERYRELFALLLEPANLPLVLHCAAGKDRTGFGSALILTALGVPWRYVVQDYLATNRLWRRETARDITLPPALAEALLGVREPLLAAAFEAARRQHGSLDLYFERSLGLDASARARLAEALLEG